MYCGFSIILFGVDVFLESLTPLAIVVVFPMLMRVLFIGEEEQRSAVRFGKRWTPAVLKCGSGILIARRTRGLPCHRRQAHERPSAHEDPGSRGRATRPSIWWSQTFSPVFSNPVK